MGPGQVMNRTPEGGTRNKGGSRVAAGGNTTDDRKIPAWTAAIIIGAGIVLFGFDKAKFKMVVGVS